MNQVTPHSLDTGDALVPSLGGRRVEWQLAPRNEGAGAALRNYWRVLLKRRKIILACILIAVCIGVAAALLVKPMYSADSTIEIARETSPVVEMSDAQPVQSNDPEFYQTQYSLLESRSLAEEVVDDLRLARNDDFLTNFGSSSEEKLPQSREARHDMATGLVMKETQVVPVRLSSIVNVRYNSPNPEMAAKVANSLAQNFIDSNLERKYEASSYAREFLQKRLGEIRARLEKSEREAVDYAGRNELIDISPADQSSNAANAPQQSLIGATLAEANSALAEARATRIAAESAYRLASNQPVEALANPALNQMRAQRSELRSEYSKLLSDFGPQYPRALALKAQIDELEKQISSESGRIDSTVSNSLRSQYQAAVANESKLAGLVSQLKGGVIDQRQRSIQYNIFQRDVDTNRALYDALLQRYKEIGIAGGVGTNNVSIVDLAQVPGSPYSPNLALNLILSLLAGAAIGIGLALLLEQLEDSAVLPEEFEQKLGVPLLGSTPQIGKDDRPIELLADPKTPLAEAYFSTLTGLRFSTNHGTPRSIVVTSSQAGEGKTTTSYALASNLARVGKRVLLIDADLRNPSVHRFNGIANDAGTSNLLIGEGSIAEHAHQSPHVANLHYMVAGPIPPNPAELLAGDNFRPVLDEALRIYDHVVIDAPPILGLADAPLLARTAEGAVFVMESGRTKATQARLALRRLLAVNSNIIGAVLTKLSRETTGYGYGYGYDYEYGDKDRSITAGES